MRKQKFLPEEHQILRALRAEGLSGQPLLLAVSGGLDSMVLLFVMARLRPILKCEMAVAHIHHGPTEVARQSRYRHRAQKFVEKAAEHLGLPFFTQQSAYKLKNEAECRDYRYQALSEMKEKWQPMALTVTAHHRDDLIETQLLRLIRGTSRSGLRGIEFLRGGRLRPLLLYSRREIEGLARKLKVNFCEDPSNQSVEPLRNWLRHKWLPALERKSRGSTKSLARSLSTIVEEDSTESQAPLGDAAKVAASPAISRPRFIKMDRSEKRKLIAHYIIGLGLSDFRQSQIDELIRRLDNRRVDFKFSLLKHQWCINAEQIKAQKSRS